MNLSTNRVTEFEYTLDGQLAVLIARNAVTGDQVTRWHYGTTLEESGVASNSLVRAKVYADSDDAGPSEPSTNGPDTLYDRVEYRYDRLGEIAEMRDQNGTEHAYVYDKLGRLIHDRVAVLGTDIDGGVLRISRSYSRAGRLERVSSWSAAEAGQGSVINDVLMRYNGFGQLVEEYQSHEGFVATATTPVVRYAYANGTDRHIRRLATTYPGGWVMGFNYGTAGGADDKLGRVYEIQDTDDEEAPLVRYTRRGLSATMRIEYAQCGTSNPLEMTYIKLGGEPVGDGGDQYTGQDRFNRNIDIRWRRGDTTTHVDRIQYGFDRASNRLWRKNVVAVEDWDELYGYDGLYQLTERQRGTLNTEKTALTAVALDQERFGFDTTGNWDRYQTAAGGTATLDQSRTHNRANEITAIDGSALRAAYDRAGNMTRMPKVGEWDAWQQPVWDAWNRMVLLLEGENTVGAYAYDGLTRRAWKESAESSTLTKRHFYYSDQWQVLEERTGVSTATNRRFVWGLRYIDDLVLRDRVIEPFTTERLYATHDQWHVISTVDEDADATERFAYRAFGESQVMDGNFEPLGASDWETRYGAYRYDQESKLYYIRCRHLHAGMGRWLSTDPLMEFSGSNLFKYVSNYPTRSVDPYGAFEFDDTWSMPHGHPTDQGFQADESDGVYEIGRFYTSLVADASDCKLTCGKCTGSIKLKLTVTAAVPKIQLTALFPLIATFHLEDSESKKSSGDFEKTDLPDDAKNSYKMAWKATIPLNDVPCDGSVPLKGVVSIVKKDNTGKATIPYSLTPSECTAESASVNMVADRVAGDPKFKVRPVRRTSSNYDKVIEGPYPFPKPQR